LSAAFSHIPALRVTIPPLEIGHAYYKYYVFIRPEMLRTGWDRDRIMASINAEGIPCFSGSCGEIYLEKAFTANGLRPIENLAAAKGLGETSLMFLVHPTLNEKDMFDTCKAVDKVMKAASG
jgi:dTDP-4-amino-4,6-dideoxygalactose transaminase